MVHIISGSLNQTDKRYETGGRLRCQRPPFYGWDWAALFYRRFQDVYCFKGPLILALRKILRGDAEDEGEAAERFPGDEVGMAFGRIVAPLQMHSRLISGSCVNAEREGTGSPRSMA